MRRCNIKYLAFVPFISLLIFTSLTNASTYKEPEISNYEIIKPFGEETKSLVLIKQPEPIGGERDIEKEIKTIQKTIETSSDETLYVEWDILNPLVCPRYTQYYSPAHKAVDIALQKGCDNKDVFAASNGVVSFSGYNGGYGYQIRIDHENGFITTYSHLNPDSVEVKKGDVVLLGRKLGKMGLTGRTTGLHLHFEIIYNGVKLNPKEYL